MNKLYYLIFGIIVFSLTIFFIKPLWMEPDSTAFYNRACLGGKDFDTPILSRAIFELLPCNELAWKIFQLFIGLCTISAIYYFGKKVLLEKDWVWTAYTSYFLLIFMLQIEDDQIAFPIIIALSAWLLHETTNKKKIIYTATIIPLTLLLWKGSFIPMILFLSYTILPLLTVLLPIGYVIYNTITTGRIGLGDPGNTIELMIGQGFLNNNILMLLLVFVKDFYKKLKSNLSLFQLSTGFDLLAFYYPKLAYYSILPVVMFSERFFEEKHKTYLVWLGLLALLLAPGVILFNAEPNTKTWITIDKAVEIQSSGLPVYNEWWVGRWFFYKGGKPSQEGGNNGPQNPIDKEWYWLGMKRKDCGEIVSSAGLLVLQQCVKS